MFMNVKLLAVYYVRINACIYLIAILIDHFLPDMAEKSHAHEIREDWKPPFLSNDEFAQLMLEVSAVYGSIQNKKWFCIVVIRKICIFWRITHCSSWHSAHSPAYFRPYSATIFSWRFQLKAPQNKTFNQKFLDLN